ncbi:histone deacetylase family protein [Desulfopila inferna]|uniref:histone deacetylase family protein n=1 Tax=Desulfopila inferna TaxID=468528 RepID=UPI001F050E67|nr:histone deacetylase [Desulfopila inferna]
MMKRTGFVYDERYLMHTTFEGHPESHYRLVAIVNGLRESGLLEKLLPIEAEPVHQRWIEAVHNIRYIVRFEEACLMGLPDFDHQDNSICRETYEIALLAVGGVLRAVDKMMEGLIDNAFCAVRPPGHHAGYDRAMGFCYFNNIAIAARYLQQKWGIKRVGVIDFDVHHGNGTQQIFEEDDSVFYYSIHEHPSFAFPGTGREFEEGVAAGTGFTLNTPILPGKGDMDYRKKLTTEMVPAFKKFKPEVILVSAGFDAHSSDLMSGINLTAEGYKFISKTIVNLAKRYADGRLISILEGGYNLEVLPLLVADHIKILAEL